MGRPDAAAADRRDGVHAMTQDCIRDVAADIEAALIRGKSSWTMRDVIRLMGKGRLRIWVTPTMSGSAFIQDGHIEIMHCSGSWNDEDARWLYDRLTDYCRETGLNWKAHGRQSWQRFLKAKDFAI